MTILGVGICATVSTIMFFVGWMFLFKKISRTYTITDAINETKYP